jgi:phage terminase large subunit
MSSSTQPPSALALALLNLGSDPASPRAEPVNDPAHPLPCGQDLAAAPEPLPITNSRETRHVRADQDGKPGVAASFEGKPQERTEAPTAPPSIAIPVSGPEVDAPMHQARAMSEAERIAWEWSVTPKLESAKLAQLLLRWRVDPVCACIEALRVVPLPYQAHVLLDLFDSPREVYDLYGLDSTNAKRQVVAPSGHGLGKTRILAVAIWLFLITHRFCMILVTAPTAEQLSGRLWGELRKMYRRLQKAHPAIAAEWEILGSSINHRNPDYADWSVVARTARADKPEGLQGAHALDDDDAFGDIAKLFNETRDAAPSGGIFVAVEEASGVANEIYEVLEGALSEPGARLLQIGNATRADGRFAENTKDRKRYAVHPLDCRMSNRDIVYRLPYRDLRGRIHNMRAKGLVEPRYWETILAECAGDEDSDRFRVRVRGLTPRSNFEQVIMTQWFDAAAARAPDPEDARKHAVVSMDFGMSGDKHGLFVRRGFAAIYANEWLPPNKPDDVTLVAARAAIDAVEVHGARTIIGDANGVGRGAMEHLANYYHVEHPELGVRVIFFNAGDKAKNTRYYRKRDQMWHHAGRRWFANLRCSLSLLDDTSLKRLRKQLAAPGAHEDESKRIWVETKDDIFKRTHEPSGNLADAALMSLMVGDESIPEAPAVDTAPVVQHPPVLRYHFDRYLRDTGQLDTGAIR